MTESVAFERDAARHLFDDRSRRRRWSTWTCSAAGRAALRQANSRFGLALSDDEIDYLVAGVQAPGAQPQRRRTDDVRAGQQRTLPAQDLQCRSSASTAQDAAASMFGMIRHTEAQRRSTRVVAYYDNAAVMEGGPVERWLPQGSPTRRSTARATRSRMC